MNSVRKIGDTVRKESTLQFCGKREPKRKLVIWGTSRRVWVVADIAPLWDEFEVVSFSDGVNDELHGRVLWGFYPRGGESERQPLGECIHNPRSLEGAFVGIGQPWHRV